MGNLIRPIVAAAAIAVAGTIGAVAYAMDVVGAGASFPYPVFAKWAAVYAAETGNRVNYQSISSAGGLAQTKAGTVDFGASDKPLSPEELASAGLGQFPIVIGGIVPVVNIAGVTAGQLKLTGPVLADIFLGKIQSWNDPPIQQLNPDLTLPDTKISVVHRADGSGTTFNFAHYLSQVSPEWASQVGADASIRWPVGIGGKGNEGVAAYSRQIKGAVGYVEYAYALQNKMSYALVQNAAGKYVQPSSASLQAAAAHADWANAKDFYLIMTNAPGDDAYPIAATSFILMPKEPKNPARARAVLDFFEWAFENGPEHAEVLGYVPLPPSLVALIQTYWKNEFKF